MRIVVTGGYGFIGARLSASLAMAGHDVMIIDDRSIGTNANLSLDVRSLISTADINIRDAEATARCIRSFRPNTVYHLAAMHFIPSCNAQPRACIETNAVGTQTILDACLGTPSVQSVVLTSSAAVYRPSDSAHDETSDVGPTDIYGHTKLWTEGLGHLFHEKTGVNVGLARLFNVFGPGETNPHFIPSIVEQIRLGDTLLLGDLSTQRDYVFVDDVVTALVALEAASRKHRLIVCNVGSEQAVYGYEVVRVFECLLGRSLSVQVDPSRLRISDRPRLLSNCQRAHSILGWRARTNLKEGLHRVLVGSALGLDPTADCAPGRI